MHIAGGSSVSGRGAIFSIGGVGIDSANANAGRQQTTGVCDVGKEESGHIFRIPERTKRTLLGAL